MKRPVLFLSLIVATIAFAETKTDVYPHAVGVPFLGFIPVADPADKAVVPPVSDNRIAEPGKAAAALSVEPIYFELDKAYLDADARAKVGEICKWMKENPNAKVKVDAYTDPSGTVAHNKTLGAKRAIAMKAALAKEGIAQSRIITVNHGGQPVERKAVVSEYTVLAD